MPVRAVYVRLNVREFELLQAMSREDRRSLSDQAAHLVSLGVHAWNTNKLFEQSLGDDDDDDELVSA